MEHCLPDKDNCYLFNKGKYYNAFEVFGAHPCGGGVRFAVWVPGARSVKVVGDFNGWKGTELQPVGSTGVWSGVCANAECGQNYKYEIVSDTGERLPLKADPFAFFSEKRPDTASIIYNPEYDWGDGEWMQKRGNSDHFASAKNIYEVHPGSWKRTRISKKASEREKENNFLSYTQLADELVPYVRKMGYTHIELMPVMEHPFDGSWGYQLTSYYSPTSRYGKPEELMYLIDKAHQSGIGVILDWVPGHFCRDEHGLVRFNGHKLFEKEMHPQWGTCKFDFGRPQVRSFLISNAVFWLREYHADGLRVDGVSSMLYLNFGVQESKNKKKNREGGETDLEAISFLREMNSVIGQYFPGVFTVAEESTAWPLVTYPPSDGGLGFHYKWDMGWMNDTLNYMRADFPFRSGCHNLLTFSTMYQFNENYILPFSHDEVVHGKASMLCKMPGDYWRRFAGLRALMVYQMTHVGAKLNFMGNEFAPFIEWRYYESLEWFLPRKFEAHRKHRQFTGALNHLYRREKALWDNPSPLCFEWIDADNNQQSVISYLRTSKSGRSRLVVVINFDVASHDEFRIGVPLPGYYSEIFNSDELRYGGNGYVNEAAVEAEKIPCHGKPYSIKVKLPSLGGIIFKRYKNVR